MITRHSSTPYLENRVTFNQGTQHLFSLLKTNAGIIKQCLLFNTDRLFGYFTFWAVSQSIVIFPSHYYSILAGKGSWNKETNNQLVLAIS